MAESKNAVGPLPVAIDRDGLEMLCRRYGIRELSLFGSVLRGDFNALSDIDVLYDLSPTSPVRTLLDLGGLAVDLEALFGRRVDMANQQRLRPELRAEIMSTRRVIYGQA